MKKALVLLILLAAPATLAGRASVGHQPFPNDYKPHPCAPPDACASLSQSDIVAAAATLRGFTLRQEWVDANWNQMLELMRPTCGKLGTCYATPGNGAIFCMDLLFPEFWSVCDRYPKDSDDFEQCSYFTRIYSFRADLRDKKTWKDAQTCAAATTARAGQPKMLDVWMEPKKIDAGYGGRFVVFALDPETRVPVQALVEMAGTRLSARAPGGKPWTNYEIEWPVVFSRVPRADGHTDLVPPQITVTADGYAPATLTVPATPGTAVVEMTPPIDELKRGKNSVTVTARDSETGKPVELRVMLGETILGYTNKPFELEIKKGEKRPEIWATSLFNRYHDVVVAPAEK